MAAERSDIPEPQQARSIKTTRQIIAATLQLLSRKSFEDISVGEIAQKAGISVGGFYARFASKEALLDWFDENLLDEELQRRKRDRTRRQPGTLEEVVEQYVTDAARFLRHHRQLLSRIALSLRSGASPASLERARIFNDQIHNEFLQDVMRHRSRIRHPDPETAVRLGSLVTSAALREQILFGERNLNSLTLQDKRLIHELTVLFLAYLLADPAAGPADGRK